MTEVTLGHPHDGHAYEGCRCICCINVRLATTPEPPAWPSETVDSLAEKMHHAYWEDRPGNPWPPANPDYHAAWLRAATAALNASEPATPSEAAHYWVGDKGVANGGNIPPASSTAAWPDWTVLANVIREVDGNHDLGAGELAARILAALQRSGESVTPPPQYLSPNVAIGPVDPSWHEEGEACWPFVRHYHQLARRRIVFAVTMPMADPLVKPERESSKPTGGAER